MRKFVLLLFCLLCFDLFAQNSIWYEQGENSLVVAEFKDNNKKAYNYLYVESLFKKNQMKSTYVLLSCDQKWWEPNIWVHGELRTFVGKDILSDNVWLIGPMFGIADGKLGFLNLQTMYRYDVKSNIQVSLLSDIEWKRIYYSMFADFYGTDKVYMHSENRLFFKVTGPIRIGANILLSLNEISNGFDIKPMAVLRIDL